MSVCPDTVQLPTVAPFTVTPVRYTNSFVSVKLFVAPSPERVSVSLLCAALYQIVFFALRRFSG